ncbi:MAG: Ppx/GppA family phosphatase [Rickettsiales bacterium]|nr:Ppx/GppA family phosphatase [Rickettsiales bacterium]
MPFSLIHAPVGVIDIGSNSVRLVIYDALKRHMRPIFNEKMLCGLGSDLSRTGRLPVKGAKEAQACFKRYVRIAQALPVVQLRAIATAALRDASDGDLFIALLEQENGVPVEIISGDEEARLAALGVYSTLFEPRGLAGDLGGGSLELSVLNGPTLGPRASLPLGVLRLWQQAGNDVPKLRGMVGEAIEKLPWITQSDCPEFYAIGGSFRALARIHMRRVNYPLRLLHQYHISRRELKKFTDDMLRLNLHALSTLKGMPAERAHMFIPSLIALQTIIDYANIEEVVVCAGGIREGLLFDELPQDEQCKDPLQAFVEDILPEYRTSSEYPEALCQWLTPLVKRAPDVPMRLVRAFCYLSDAAIGMHPECRAQWAFDLVLYSSLNGITHRQRVWLALAMYHRYRSKLKLNHPALSLLSEHELASARLLGSGAAMAYLLSGGAAQLLAIFDLSLTGERITLKPDDEVRITDEETREKLLEGLGESLKALSSRSK